MASSTVRDRLYASARPLLGQRRLDRAFRTEDPKLLKQDLERLLDAIMTMGAEYAAPQLTPTGPFYEDFELAFGEAARVDATAGTVEVLLPPATYETAGQACGVIVEAGFAVVQPRGDSLVQGEATHAAPHGLTLYVSDGANWWATFGLAPSDVVNEDTLMTVDGAIVWAARTYQPQVPSANTVGLWRLSTGNDLSDQSGNGNTLTTFGPGLVRGASISPTVGGVYFDGTVGLRAPSSAALQLVGDMTVAFMVSAFRDGTLNNSHFFAHMTNGETANDNQLYGLQFGTFPALTYLHEQGAGVNEQHQWGTLAGNGVFPSFNQPLMVHFVRRSNVAELYMQGVAWVPFSGTLNAPTGGTSGRFTIGCSSNGAGGTFANGFNGIIADFLIENRAWTAAEVLANYNRCAGPALGRRA